MVFCCGCVDENEQAVVNTCCGERYLENGPGCYSYFFCHDVETRSALLLEEGEYAVVFDELDGTERAVYGPLVAYLGAWDQATIYDCPTLSACEYITVRNRFTGEVRTVAGPTKFRPRAEDVPSEAMPVHILAGNEYIRVKDADGVIGVVRGEARFVPGPFDEVLDGGVRTAVCVDDHTAVIVRNEDTGRLLLHTEHGIFFPSAYQRVEAVQKKIVLEPHEACVYIDAQGEFTYVAGGTSFFLPPFCKLLSQHWSCDPRMEGAQRREVTIFDTRPTPLRCTLNCRTRDNVELEVCLVCTWSIASLREMVQQTCDAPSDICLHARSRIIQEVARLPLVEFMGAFNDVVRGACMGDAFYAGRGVVLHTVEVAGFHCASEETERIMREIIAETAERLRKLEGQAGENELALITLGGLIEQEKVHKTLVEIRKSHLKIEAAIEGAAEAMKIIAFLTRATGDPDARVSEDQALLLYRMLRKLDSVRMLAGGPAEVFMVPEDCNLSLCHTHPPGGLPPAQTQLHTPGDAAAVPEVCVVKPTDADAEALRSIASSSDASSSSASVTHTAAARERRKKRAKRKTKEKAPPVDQESAPKPPAEKAGTDQQKSSDTKQTKKDKNKNKKKKKKKPRAHAKAAGGGTSEEDALLVMSSASAPSEGAGGYASQYYTVGEDEPQP